MIATWQAYVPSIRMHRLLAPSSKSKTSDDCHRAFGKVLYEFYRFERLGRVRASFTFGGLELEVRFHADPVLFVIAGFSSVIEISPVLCCLRTDLRFKCDIRKSEPWHEFCCDWNQLLKCYEWASRVKENELHLLYGLNGRLV
ncbi:hypothetical protein VNO80_31201 [Phaseolus coccineus]|uniref:Uncharacterized protein n=1 Tax=Phaseolus coccineus TaxID=3886 RepID=A0AAN9LC22_PHACN